MKPRCSLFLAAVVAIGITVDPTNGLLTPSRHTAPTLTTTAKASSTRLGNDAAAAVPDPRGGAKESGGTATIKAEVFNLIKSIVGAGKS
ncbi:MAG: hypothetical protein SGARI_005712 [Bacillariaceae sp.]